MEAKEEVRSRLSIEDVVAGYVELKRSGRNFKGLSPFTSEKTPSFMVSPEKQIWHDFSSGKGGDIFSFVMEMEGIDFMAALDMLARKAGVDMSQYARGDGQTAKRKKQIIDMHTAAVQFYHITMSKNEIAKEYLVKKRGLSRGAIEEFKLGYSPGSGTVLVDYLEKKGYAKKDIERAGLAVQRGGRTIDMFRDRLMVPLADGQGQYIGFSARLMKDIKNAPKYINTQQTLVYDKSRHVFGLHHAKQAIRENDSAIIAEGQFDVVSAHQAGMKNVVAAAGTALTVHHLKQLSRLSPEIKLAFDQDAAGIKATIRAIALAQEAEVNLSIITMPEGTDPDELVRKDFKKWQKVVEEARYVMDWLIAYYRTVHDLTSARGKREYAAAIIPVISKLKDPIEQDHYLQTVANEIGVSVEAARERLNQILGKAKKPPPRKPIKAEKTGPSLSAYQDSFLGLNALYPEVRDSLEGVELQHLEGADRQKLLNYLQDLGQNKLPKELPETLSDLENYAKIIVFRVEELYGSWTQSDRLVESMSLARRIIKDNTNRQKAKLSTAIKEAEEAGDAEHAKKLLDAYNRLLKEK